MKSFIINPKLAAIEITFLKHFQIRKNLPLAINSNILFFPLYIYNKKEKAGGEGCA